VALPYDNELPSVGSDVRHYRDASITSFSSTDSAQQTATIGKQPTPSIDSHRHEVASAVVEINAELQAANHPFSLSIDPATGRVVMTVVSPDDGSVILQIPSATSLAIARNINPRFGFLLDQYL
jgi:uncharacterized FlaG/YvyC family protein